MQIKYNQEFPKFPYPRVADQSSFAFFVSEEQILIATFGTGFYKFNTDMSPVFSFSKQVSFIYSSQTTNACYPLVKDCPIVYNLTETSNYVTSKESTYDPFTALLSSSLSNPNSIAIEHIKEGELESQSSSCKKPQFSINPNS